MVWTPQVVAALAAVTVGGAIDAFTGRIPNYVTLTLVAVGLVANVTLGQWQLGVVGLFAAFLLHYGLWTVKVEKAGDAKLMIGVGAALGAHEMFEASAFSALLYLPIGLGVLAATGKLGNLVALAKRTWRVRVKNEKVEGEAPAPTMLRTGPILAVGTYVACFTDGWLWH